MTWAGKTVEKEDLQITRDKEKRKRTIERKSFVGTHFPGEFREEGLRGKRVLSYLKILVYQM